ncbi:uncharacterized protein C8R40DRAFT_1066133 [Lentinula edodes]|uniref:uncharacterized protein n=1 Tax=Lentinula edodes TaxID=5353 RepID=UPI001E8D418B|nr:uncharacterized protein C8R40DRAFT_1066133 [Lentinula edodes]KAH7879996.1 hypothetical protein C8R40DRAFT_1066133 [Lentinula edodes]
MSFGSDSGSFLEYALSLPDPVGPDPETSDPSDQSSPSDHNSEQESVQSGTNSDPDQSSYDSEFPGPFDYDYLHESSDFDSDHPGPYDLRYLHSYPSSSASDSVESSHSFASDNSEAPELRPGDDRSGHPHLGPDGRLVDSERERRRVLGLCFYCGGEHMKVDCLKLQARTGQHYDADNSESDVPGSDDGSE